MKNLKIIIPLMCMLIVVPGYAQVGEKFPEIETELLTNDKVVLPQTDDGKYTLVGLAWSKKAEDDLNGWLQPVYDMFINQNTFIPVDYNVNIYFMSVFSGVNKSAYNSVKTKVKEALDPELIPHVLFYKGDFDEYRKKLKLKDKSVPYFFVVDENGKIVHATSGKYSDKKLSKMEDLVMR